MFDVWSRAFTFFHLYIYKSVLSITPDDAARIFLPRKARIRTVSRVAHTWNLLKDTLPNELQRHGKFNIYLLSAPSFLKHTSFLLSGGSRQTIKCQNSLLQYIQERIDTVVVNQVVQVFTLVSEVMSSMPNGILPSYFLPSEVEKFRIAKSMR